MRNLKNCFWTVFGLLLRRWTVLLLLFYLSGIAQIKHIDTQNIDAEILKIYSTENGIKLHLYKKNKGFKNIESGYLKGQQTPDYFGGIIYGDVNIILDEDESPLFFKNGYLLTKQVCWTDYHIEINRYKITSNQLIFINNLIISGIEHNISIDEYSGFIAVSDFSEGYGTSIKIYNNNFEKQLVYSPFKKSHEYIHYDFSNKHLSIVARETLDRPFSKMVLIDVETNKVKFEKNIQQKLESIYIKTLKNKTLISGFNGKYNQLICLDNKGHELWSKIRNIDHYLVTPMHKGNTLYTIHKKTIHATNAITGEDIWEYSLQATDNTIILSLSFLSSKTHDIIIVTGTPIIPTRGSSDAIHFDNIQLLDINTSGNLNSTIQIGNNIEKVKTLQCLDALYLIIDQKIQCYEKE